MTEVVNNRFAVQRPKFLGDEHWESISTELERLKRSLDAGDHSQALSDLKCLVESVARVTLDIAGEPAQSNDSFDKTVTRAHDMLARQPGHALAKGGDFAKMASQACRIARNLGNIRNEYGGGHGRARTPTVRDEMVDLGLDGSLTWVRWAVRRLGLFSEGRPSLLIKDLIEDPATFHSGVLKRRLEAANLAEIDVHHQQELGVAVGQRAMRGTFVVRRDGLDPCLKSDDLEVWPKGYRVGLMRGLWFSPDGQPTVTPQSIKEGLQVLDPVADCSDEIDEQIKSIVESTQAGFPWLDQESNEDIVGWLKDRVKVRPEREGSALILLYGHIGFPF